MMGRVELQILYQDGTEQKVRAVANKWQFQDSVMGEQFVTFSITSEKPIDWAIGDFCVFRGETFTLNYIPSVTQKGRSFDRQDSYTYENVKLEAYQEELGRIIILDITPTTGDYVPSLGTNYTGSSRFQLYCGETSVNGRTLTAVCALAAKIQANLDRAFPDKGWRIYVDTTSTYVSPSGDRILVTHTDDKVLSFDNTTALKALAEVHNTFDLNYCIRGREIYIGYNIKNLTSDNDDEVFVFGYGKGYPTAEESGTALFQIKRMSNSTQKIVTRLRAFGSTKNMPYRYYNKKYNLSQSLFPTNLQLPDTFETPSVKSANNASRDAIYGIDSITGLPYIRHVKGETNDAYIDKNDDADGCIEGVREDSARWDGSNSDLSEIYPTIEGATYGELRGALVPDQDGETGSNSFPGYGHTERVDSFLAIGYISDGVLIDDANKGSGILPESGSTGMGISRAAVIGQTILSYNTLDYGDFTPRENFYAGEEQTLFVIQDVFAGEYAMAPTIGAVIYGVNLSSSNSNISADFGFQITIRQRAKSYGTTETIAVYTSDFIRISVSDGIKEIELPEIPDVKEGSSAKVQRIEVTELSDITVVFTPIIRNVSVPSDFTDDFGFVYQVGNSRIDSTVTYNPEYTWIDKNDDGSMEENFHVFIKDMGFDITACLTDETPVVSMKSGRCVGREFEIGESVQKVTYNGKKGYMLTLNRATDSSLNTYYPSQNDPISVDDYFVLLNINMPDAYIKMAEVRLLKAATDYLADNCDTVYTYQPYLDDIYLQRNYDNMIAEGTPEKSIFWRLYAGLKFTFRGIPSNDEDPLPLVDLTINKIVIQMGDGLTPKVEMTLNDDVQQTTLQKLTITVDRIYNSISGAGGGNSASSYALLLNLIKSEGKKLYLSKKTDDTAAGKITFEQGLDAQEPSTMNGLTNTGVLAQDGDVIIGKNDSSDNPVMKSANFNRGTAGWELTHLGNMEVESLTVRSLLQVTELLINRLQAQEGDTIFSDNDQITAIDHVEGSDTYVLTLKEKWEGYFTAMQYGAIVKGIINTLAAKQAGVSDYSDTDTQYQESDGENLYYTSWMKVINVHCAENDGTPGGDPLLAKNQIRVALWPDSHIDPTTGETVSEIPSGKNFAPCVNMTIARWGCFLPPDDPDISTAESARRMRMQQLFFISTSEGRIMKLTGVDKPILETWNYGTTLGMLPDFIYDYAIADDLVKGRDYLYAQGIVVSDLILVDKQGKPHVYYVDCGIWRNGADMIVEGETPTPGNGIYLVAEHNDISNQYETHDVWWLGCKWRALVHHPYVKDGATVYEAPKWNSPNWLLVEGDQSLQMTLHSTNGSVFRAGYVNTAVIPQLWYGNMDITADLGDEYWVWTRHTENSVDGSGNPIFTPEDDLWNANHGLSDARLRHRILTLTDADMPTAWSRTNRAVFTVRVTVNDGKTETIIQQQVIA